MARPPKRPRRRNGRARTNGAGEQQRPQQRRPSGTIDRHPSSSTIIRYHARHHRLAWLACFIVCREQRGQGANKMDVLRGFGARGIRTRGVARRGVTRIRLVNRGSRGYRRVGFTTHVVRGAVGGSRISFSVGSEAASSSPPLPYTRIQITHTRARERAKERESARERKIAHACGGTRNYVGKRSTRASERRETGGEGHGPRRRRRQRQRRRRGGGEGARLVRRNTAMPRSLVASLDASPRHGGPQTNHR